MLWNTHVIFVITNILMWIFYVLILKTNPGYIRNTDRSSYDEVIKMVRTLKFNIQSYYLLKVKIQSVLICFCLHDFYIIGNFQFYFSIWYFSFQLSNPSAWNQYAENDMHNPLYNLCHTCKILRPVRAKHCRQCH